MYAVCFLIFPIVCPHIVFLLGHTVLLMSVLLVVFLQSRRKKAAVKKTSKRKKSFEHTAPMAPGRVLGLDAEARKRLLETDQPPARVTRQKPNQQTVPIHQESPLHRDRESSLQLDGELLSMQEDTSVRLDLDPLVDRNEPLDSPVISEEP